MSVLSRPEFHNKEAAYAYAEARIWPHCATCSKFGERERVSKIGGKSTRIGVCECYKYRQPFTVKGGTIFESSHVSMCLWLQAIHLMVSSKKGISSHQLHRVLEITYKSAWFLTHRIRECMRSGALAPFGSGGGVVEVDETFIGNKHKKAEGARLCPQERGAGPCGSHHGPVRSFMVKDVTKAPLLPSLRDIIAREAPIYTDQAKRCTGLGLEFVDHDFTTHSKVEYGRGVVHTNTMEAYFSIFKHGMKGIYQRCNKKHPHRDAAEFEFRYNNRVANGVDDAKRAVAALWGSLENA